MARHRRTTTTTEDPEDTKPRPSKYDLKKIPARVDRVHIKGLLRTYDDYVMRAASDLFKANNFQEIMLEAVAARSYLEELGIFKDVFIHIDVSQGEKATPDGLEVTFKGVEVPRVTGSIGTEIGQNDSSVRTELSFPNCLGRGESISIQGSYSYTRANDVSIKFWKSFFHTRFMANRPEFTFSIFRNLDRFAISSFQNANIGINAAFHIRSLFPFEVAHSFEYETAMREITLLSKNVPFVIRKQCGPALTSLVRYSASFDGRDSNIFPTQGIFVRTINEYCGLGGNVAYMSGLLHGELNIPLRIPFLGTLVGQVAGRVGVIKETKNTRNLPINKLFYCGGPLTLRGFKYGGAGPLVDGTPLGANTFWAAGFHLWGPLPYSRVFKGLASNFRTHLFYNVGNFNTFSTENMRATVGAGIAFKLGDRARIELNYCTPVRKCMGDKYEENGFQFGIGYEFV